MGNPRSLRRRGFPAALAKRGSVALRTLGCDEGDASAADSIQSLTATLGEIATASSTKGADSIGSVFLLLAAAIHAATGFPEPKKPLPVEDVPKPISPMEWLLFACAERAASLRPDDDDIAMSHIIDVLEEALTRPDKLLLSQTSPLVSYALGPFLALCTGHTNDERTTQAGTSLGKLLRLQQETRTITSAWRLAPRPVLLGALAEEEGLGPRFRLALAAGHMPQPDRLPMLAVLGDKRLGDRIQEETKAWTADTSPLDKRLRNLAKEFSSEIERRTKSARFFGLPGMVARTNVKADLDHAITLIHDALIEDPELRAAWEIQRWGGPFGKRAVAKMFPQGLVALALSEAGDDITERATPLVQPNSADGFRYFEEFRSIPPDADDLAMALQLSARMPARTLSQAALVWPVELLVRNTAEDGAIPVWLYQDLKEPMPADAPAWHGPRCLAVSANVLVGLAESDLPLPEGYFERALAWIVRTWAAEAMASVFFYNLPYTRFVLMRLAEVAQGRVTDPSLLLQLRSMAQKIVETILGERRADGSLGGVLSTALHFGALLCSSEVCAGTESFDPEPTLMFLITRQDYDGLYPDEPLYVTAGKDHRLSAHGARPMTAAVCLSTLVQARKKFFLAQPRSNSADKRAT